MIDGLEDYEGDDQVEVPEVEPSKPDEELPRDVPDGDPSKGEE